MAKKKKQEYIQLDLIPPTEIEKLYTEFKDVKDSSDKVRRGVFAKHTELSKKVQELTCEVENLQKQLITLSEWIITQLGHVDNVLKKQDGSHGETISLHVTSLNVEHVRKLHPSQVQEITDILILSA